MVSKPLFLAWLSVLVVIGLGVCGWLLHPEHALRWTLVVVFLPALWGFIELVHSSRNDLREVDAIELPTFAEAVDKGVPSTVGARGSIGVVLPLSGAFASYGQDSLKGVLLAASIFEQAPTESLPDVASAAGSALAGSPDGPRACVLPRRSIEPGGSRDSRPGGVPPRGGPTRREARRRSR